MTETKTEPDRGFLAQLKLLPRHLRNVVTHRDQFAALHSETARMGSAAVEAVGYLRDDLRRLEDSLVRLEGEIAAMRRLLAEREGELVQPPDRG
jgi:hypothetical protein